MLGLVLFVVFGLMALLALWCAWDAWHNDTKVIAVAFLAVAPFLVWAAVTAPSDIAEDQRQEEQCHEISVVCVETDDGWIPVVTIPEER